MDPKEMEITEKLKAMRDLSKSIYDYLAADDMNVRMVKSDLQNLLKRRADVNNEISILESSKKAMQDEVSKLMDEAKAKAASIIRDAEDKMLAVVRAREEARGIVDKAKEEARSLLNEAKNKLEL